MHSILINPSSDQELKLVLDFLHKSNMVSIVLTQKQVEHDGVAILMHEADRSQKVSRKQIDKKLLS